MLNPTLSASYLLALLHDLYLLIPHVQHLLKYAGTAMQRSILRLQAADLRGKLLNLLM